MLEGSVFIGGAVVQWLRDGLGLIERAADIEAPRRLGARQRRRGAGAAFAGLGAPWWDGHARGALLGLTAASQGPHRPRRPRRHRAADRRPGGRHAAATAPPLLPNCASTAAPRATTC